MSATPSTGRSTADPPREARPGARPPVRRTTGSTSPRRPSSSELHTSRRRFTLTGMAIQTGALILVMGLYGFAPDAMGEPAIGTITWALLSGAGLVFLTFVMAIAYSRKAREWEGMAAAALEHAERQPAERDGEVRAMSVFAVTGEFNGLAVAIFAVVLAITLLITRWAASRTKTTTEFYTAGRGISGRNNGLAIAGDYLSASTFLGYAGLMFLFGFDGWIIGLGACMSFIVVLYLLAERMRNAGKFTLADVLTYRLKEKPARAAAASSTLLVTGIYLIAQLVGAGALLQALAGIDFAIAV